MAAQAAAASKNASLPMVQQNQRPFSLLAHSVPFSIPGMKVLNINDEPLLVWTSRLYLNLYGCHGENNGQNG